MKKKELKQKSLREQMEAENPNTAFPRLRMSKREFTQFVIADMLKNIKPLDRQYILRASPAHGLLFYSMSVPQKPLYWKL